MATPNDRENRTSKTTGVVPGSPQDPFYHSTGVTKTVTIDGKTYTGIDVGSTKPPAATEIGMISPSSGLAITGTERNMAKEREAMNLGMTKEYIASRGGINSMGYFNDTPLSGQLNAAEYKSVTKSDGTIDTTGMARILQKKAYDEAIAKGENPELVIKRLQSEWGNLFGLDTPITAGNGGTVGTGGGVSGGTVGGTGGGTGSPVTSFIPGTNTLAVGTPEQVAARKSAYDLLYEQFNQYGLGSLVTPLKELIVQNVPPAEFTIRLRESKPYQNRFAANKQRIAKGLRPLTEAEYIGTEDAYQEVMRRYGLPESYYAQTVDPETGIKIQKGFEQLLAGDVSVSELEDRVMTAQNRVINAAPEIARTLRQYYPEIGNSDILAYTLDPEKAISDIRRKVTAAEIGGAAAMAGLGADVTRAEELARYGVTGEAARQGFRTVAEVAPRGTQLSEFYKQSPYTQATAEQEVFGLAGASEAERQRKKLTQLEQAAFSGSAGMTGGALARDRAGAF
jgi:hypothetical protein